MLVFKVLRPALPNLVPKVKTKKFLANFAATEACSQTEYLPNEVIRKIQENPICFWSEVQAFSLFPFDSCPLFYYYAPSMEFEN